MTDPNEAAAQVSRSNEAIDELVAANHASNSTMLALVETVRKETAARDRKIDQLERNHEQTKWLIVAVCVAVVLMLSLGVVNAINLSTTRRQTDQTAKINGFLLDCVNSTGACGKANVQQQKRFLDSVKQYELTGFYCARNNPGPVDPKGESFLKCMDKLYPGGPTLQSRWP